MKCYQLIFLYLYLSIILLISFYKYNDIDFICVNHWLSKLIQFDIIWPTKYRIVKNKQTKNININMKGNFVVNIW